MGGTQTAIVSVFAVTEHPEFQTRCAPADCGAASRDPQGACISQYFCEASALLP
jgi:hypothetical protein